MNNMKKFALVLALGGIAATSFGQGNVNFANTSGSQNVSTNAIIAISQSGASLGASGIAGATSGLVTGSSAAPFGYYYALLMQSYSGSGPTVATSLTTLLSTGWIYSGTQTATNALGLGRIAGGANALTTAGDAVDGSEPNNQFIVVGWSVADGTSWSAFSSSLQAGTLAVGSYVGISSVGTGIPSTSPSETIFGGTSGIQSGFTLNIVQPVPEPATIALASLGGFSLLAFRRRNSKA